MKKCSFLLIFIFITLAGIYSESIYFSTRVGFSNSQFWERNDHDFDNNLSRRMFANYFSGTMGMGFEMEIWDMGKKRGSRLFFKGGTDLVFSGLSYIGGYDEYTGIYSIENYTTNGNAFYIGLDWDIFIGGSFPKTDFIWGFGCIFNFIFPVYSPNYNAAHFREKYSFYAVPSVLFGYDIFLLDSKFKLTPQMRVGFTCNPLIPNDLTGSSEGTRDFIDGGWHQTELYSGIYLDFSLAFSFANIKWKE